MTDTSSIEALAREAGATAWPHDGPEYAFQVAALARFHDLVLERAAVIAENAECSQTEYSCFAIERVAAAIRSAKEK